LEAETENALEKSRENGEEARKGDPEESDCPQDSGSCQKGNASVNRPYIEGNSETA
jgi:hypothetical protein